MLDNLLPGAKKMNNILRLQTRTNLLISAAAAQRLELDSDYGPKSAFYFDPGSDFTKMKLTKELPFHLKSFYIKDGKTSYFGGSTDKGDRLNGQANVTSFGNACLLANVYRRLFDWSAIQKYMTTGINPFDFPGTPGLSAFLNPDAFYCALPIEMGVFKNLDLMTVKIINPRNGLSADCVPVTDYGPAKWTDRTSDLSKGLMDYLGLVTDDKVEIFFEI